jgi:hypothetical protein
LFHGGLVGGNCVSGIPRNSWAVHPSHPRWSLVIGMRVQLPLVIVAVVSICVADDVVLPLVFLLHGLDD